MSIHDPAPPITFGPGQMRIAKGPAEFMRAATAPLYDMTPIKWDGFTGDYLSHAWFGQGLLFSKTTNDAVTISRSKAHAESSAHLVFVQRHLYGNIRGHAGNVVIDRDPGSVYIIDKALSTECVQFPTSAEGIYVPKWMIEFDPDAHSGMMRFPDQGVMGRVLSAELAQIFENLMTHNALEFDQIDRFIACIRVAIGTDHGDMDIRRKARDALMDLIQSYILENLLDPDFGISNVLAKFGVSRASLYRMFDPYGGVRQYISDRRLYKAIFEITQHPLKRGDLARISEKWGFSSAANFNRSVKRHFGVSPGSLVYASNEPDFDLLDKAPVQRPLRKLATPRRIVTPSLRPLPTLLSSAQT